MIFKKAIQMTINNFSNDLDQLIQNGLETDAHDPLDRSFHDISGPQVLV
jgi:hypothetical protein